MARGKQNFLMAAAGCAVGAVNGIFGGGGGMLVVPLLTAAGGKPPLVAHATAILVILPVSLGMLAGGVAGAQLLDACSPAAVTMAFAAVMFAAGLRMAL